MTKSLFHILSAVWSLLVWSIPISSCTDDLKSSQTTDRIHFTSAIDNTWTSLATFFRATKIGIWTTWQIDRHGAFSVRPIRDQIVYKLN